MQEKSLSIFEDHVNTCKRLLTPVDRPLHIKNFLPTPELFANWGIVEDCINRPETFRYSLIDKNNEKISIPEYYSHWNSTNIQSKEFVAHCFNNGAGLSIERFGTYNTFTKKILAVVESQFYVDCDIHLYCGLDQAASFKIHEDTPSNFIIQISGTTKWKVFKERCSSLFPVNTFYPDQTELDEPDIEVELEPGDGLYIPARSYHCAQPSTSRISLSIPCWPVFMSNSSRRPDRSFYKIN